jgi:hypothetical protein
VPRTEPVEPVAVVVTAAVKPVEAVIWALFQTIVV